MTQERYVLLLIEESCFGGEGTFMGYWTGTRHMGNDIWYPGACNDKHDDKVKIYTSKKRAENAVDKLKDKFTYVKNARIETLD